MERLVGRTIVAVRKSDTRVDSNGEEYDSSQQRLILTFADGGEVSLQSETQYSDQESWITVE